VREGYGEYTWADGYTYRGMWQGDRTHGVGCWGPTDVGLGGQVVRFSPFVRSYCGSFVQEMRHGFGVAELWEDPFDPAAGDYSGVGYYYEGSWAQDLFDGVGTLRYRPFSARSFFSDLCRVEYDGEFQQGNREGEGVLQQVLLDQYTYEDEAAEAQDGTDVAVTNLNQWIIGDCTTENLTAALEVGHNLDALAHLLIGLVYRGTFKANEADLGTITSDRDASLRMRVKCHVCDSSRTSAQAGQQCRWQFL